MAPKTGVVLPVGSETSSGSYDDDAKSACLLHAASADAAAYPEKPCRLQCIADHLKRHRLLESDRIKRITARNATKEELELFHSPDHIDRLESTGKGACSDEQATAISAHYDTVYIDQHTSDAAKLAAGCSIELVDAVLSDKIRNGFALVRPPGHHASPAAFCGYSFYNNCALAALSALNKGIQHYPPDPALVAKIKKMLDPPSALPYNLSDPDRKDFSQHGQSPLFMKLLKGKKHGTFLEAGALDGEGLSNSLMLEREFEWTGLLIEPDPTNYAKMLTKHRKATHLDACIGTDPSKSQSLQFRSYEGDASWFSRVQGRGLKPLQPDAKFEVVTVNCFPLSAILEAAELYHIDVMMLDLEGLEPDVIKHFDWEAFDIPVVVLECFLCLDSQGNFVTKDPKLIRKRNFQKKVMESVGYHEALYVEGLDIVYIRNDADL